MFRAGNFRAPRRVEGARAFAGPGGRVYGRVRAIAAAILVPAAWLPFTASAQSATAPVSSKLQVLPTIVVTATRVPSPDFDVPAAIGVIDSDEIVDGAPAVGLSQSLARIPGVVAQDRQSYAQDSQISIRGFGSRASFGVRGIVLLVDGIPVSRPDGQGQTDVFDLASAQRIEVLRGPFSVLYGNAAGGVIQIFTRDGPPRPTLSLDTLYGSYGTRIERLDLGGTEGRFNYMIDGTHFSTDGYRRHSAAQRDNVRAKFSYSLGKDSSLTLLLNGENQPFAEDPSGLTKAQIRQDPRQAVPNVFLFGAGESHRDRQVGLVYEQQVGDDDHLHATAYSGTRRVIQFLPFSGASPNGGGAVVDLKDRSYGGGARWIHDFSLAGAPADVIAGVQYDRLVEERKGWVNDDGLMGDLRRNERDGSTQTGEYAQAEWKPGNWVIMAGLRHSGVKFTSNDFYVTPADPDDSGRQSFSHTNPVAGVMYRINPHVNAYVNYGRGFETPVLSELAYRPDGGSGFNTDLKPSGSQNYEAGVKSAWGSARLNVAVYKIDTDNEIVVGADIDGRSTFRNAGRTQRKGIEADFQDQLPGGFGVYAAYTWLDAKFAASDLAGNFLPGVPRQIVYTAFSWAYAPLGFKTSIDAAWRDRMYVNDGNSDFSNSYAVVNCQAGFQQITGDWKFKEFGRINNLLNRNYIGAVIANASNVRYFEPEPMRNYMIGFSASYAF